MRAFEGLYLVGHKARALEVHPQILEQDRELRTRSDLAQKTYQNIPQGEKERLEESFLIKSGVTIKKVGGSKKKFKEISGVLKIVSSFCL